MKKHTVKGKSLQQTSDKSLAHAHKEGASVKFVQPAQDRVWGMYIYGLYFRYGPILEEAEKNYQRMQEALMKCRNQALCPKTHFRNVPDDIRNELEVSSMLFVMTTKMGIEYMTIEMLSALNNVANKEKGTPTVDWTRFELPERLNILKKNLSIGDKTPPVLDRVLFARDIVEHPTPERLANANKQEWKNVHLSYVLSGELDGAWEELIPFLNSFGESFERYMEEHKHPGTLTGVQRGLKFTGNYKLPTNDAKDKKS